jgi:hypothetical protein
MSPTSNASGKSERATQRALTLSSLTLSSLALLCIVALFAASPLTARADESRYESFRFGQQAMGMGGAVVAYPGEPEASYYNPAALALQGHGVVFSGGVQLWGFDWLVLTGSFRPDPVYSGPKDEAAALTLALPSSSVLSRSFKKGEHVIALSSFLTRDDEESFGSSLSAALTQQAGTYDESVQRAHSDIVRYTGLSYAWRFKPKTSLGLSVFYVTRNQSSQIKGLRRSIPDGQAQSFDIADGSVSISDGGLMLKVGFFHQLTRQWSMGLACSTPTLRIYGEGSIAETRARSGPVPTLETLSVSSLRSESQTPWTCRAGAGWKLRPNLRLTSDLSVYASNRYQRLAWQRPADEFSTFDAHFSADVDAGWLANVAFGAEWMIDGQWPVRGGLFTNFSAAADLPSAPSRYQPAKVHLWGLTVSGGYAGKERSLNVGADFQWGLGSDAVPGGLDTLLDQPAFARVDRQQYRLILFVSGAFEFAKHATNDLIEESSGLDPITP